jgi:hypothetical protein
LADEAKKKRKTVRWKTGDALTEVKIFESLEPEGEYYGGGSGLAEHGYGDSLGEGNALKNRLVDEEEDLMDWQNPIGRSLPDSTIQC